MSENIVKSSKQKLSDYFRDRAKNGMPPEYQNVVVDRDRLFAAAIELDKLRADFKNFHRLLCERFDYDHDEIDWERDQLSLIEWIAQRRQDEAAGQRICLGCGEPYPCASDCPAGTAIPVKVAADETFEQWISVADRWPPPHRHVWCLNHDGRQFEGCPCYGMHAPFFTIPHGDGSPSNTAPSWIGVTHWRELPARPSEKATTPPSVLDEYNAEMDAWNRGERAERPNEPK